MTDTMSTDGDPRVRIWVSAIIGVVVATALVWYVSGGPFFELLPRIEPTIAEGGVGTDWSAGASVPLYSAVLLLTKIVVGVATLGILYMVIVHWAIFYRLADRMQPPRTGGRTATDGGRDETGPRGNTARSDGGEDA